MTRQPAFFPEKTLAVALFVGAVALVLMCSCGGSTSVAPPAGVKALTVTTLEDLEQPPAGTMTLRSAIAQVGADETIEFSPALNGGTIQLKIIGESHSVLMGEVYSGMTYQGYAERDYGKSALYAKKNLTIDASNLPDGITIRWSGDDSNRARVLAVYGNLTLKNVKITGGYSSAEPITGGTQPYTLARGGGLAVWGIATLSDCAITGNKIAGDLESSRDRGTYGGGIYSDGLIMTNCVIAGNSAIGYGAAGGGIYSVGGADNSNSVQSGNDATIQQSTISGNRVTAQHAYGGGVFTLGGGPTNRATMYLTNCTIARNLAEDNPDLPEVGQYYYRGGGIYMGGGSLVLVSSTVAENQVTGHEAIFSNKSNMGGGGIAATIGDAHVVEDMTIQNSIVVGNKLQGVANDVFTGSLINFNSYGYNLFGVLDFSQILVPVPDWTDLVRKHYPKVGDHDGVLLSDAVSVDQAHRDASITSAGVDLGEHVVLWYPPAARAIDQIPSTSYTVTTLAAGYTGFGVPADDFLNRVVAQVRTKYGAIVGAEFGSSFGDLTGVTFYGPAVTWPSNQQNAPWIAFWRSLDSSLGNQIGTVQLGEDFWESFTPGPIGAENFSSTSTNHKIQPVIVEQRGSLRDGTLLDIGAIEH